MSAFIPGFFLGLSFILAIGAQNAFVLRQGIRREHVLLCVLACAISDALLISLGVAGFGSLIDAVPWFGDVMRYGGAAFLLAYGAMSFRSAMTASEAMEVKGQAVSNWKTVLATILALTWLNPHVYLDTVVLLGSISAQYGEQRFVFGAGAVLASFTFFFSLSYGARLLAPLFTRPAAWRGLDVVIGLTMWAIAAALVFNH